MINRLPRPSLNGDSTIVQEQIWSLHCATGFLAIGHTQHLLLLFSYFIPPALNQQNCSHISEWNMAIVPQVFVTSPSAVTLCSPSLLTLTCIFAQSRWLFLWELCTGPSGWGGAQVPWASLCYSINHPYISISCFPNLPLPLDQQFFPLTEC